MQFGEIIEISYVYAHLLILLYQRTQKKQKKNKIP